MVRVSALFSRLLVYLGLGRLFCLLSWFPGLWWCVCCFAGLLYAGIGVL